MTCNKGWRTPTDFGFACFEIPGGTIEENATLPELGCTSSEFVVYLLYSVALALVVFGVGAVLSVKIKRRSQLLRLLPFIILLLSIGWLSVAKLVDQDLSIGADFVVTIPFAAGYCLVDGMYRVFLNKYVAYYRRFIPTQNSSRKSRVRFISNVLQASNAVTIVVCILMLIPAGITDAESCERANTAVYLMGAGVILHVLECLVFIAASDWMLSNLLSDVKALGDKIESAIITNLKWMRFFVIFGNLSVLGWTSTLATFILKHTAASYLPPISNIWALLIIFSIWYLRNSSKKIHSKNPLRKKKKSSIIEEKCAPKA